MIFIGLHVVLAHPERSRIKQVFLGGCVGLVAFEIAGSLAPITRCGDTRPDIEAGPHGRRSS